MIARDIMTDKVVSVGPGHSVRHAVSIMLDNRISGLPVLDDDGHLIGILTEGDLLRREELGSSTAGAENATADEAATIYVRAQSWRVSDVMSLNVITVGEDTPIDRICSLMLDRDVKRLPVTRDGSVVGIVSRSDLLRVIAAAAEDHVAAGDEALVRAIRARLNSDLGLSEVGVDVQHGHVMLTGSVPTSAQLRAARVAAESVAGVASVTCRLALPEAGRESYA